MLSKQYSARNQINPTRGLHKNNRNLRLNKADVQFVVDDGITKYDNDASSADDLCVPFILIETRVICSTCVENAQ